MTLAALPSARPVDVLLAAINAHREGLAAEDEALSTLAKGLTNGIMSVEEALQVLEKIVVGSTRP